MMMRPIPLHRYLSVMRERGFEADRVLRGSGIDAAGLGDPHCLVEENAYLRVVDTVIRLTGDDGIGIAMGQARELGDFRILGCAAAACRSVRQSVEEFWGRYGDAFGLMAKLAVRDGDGDRLTVEVVVVPDLPVPARRFFVEEALFLLVKIGGEISGSRPRFESLDLAYPEPGYGGRYAALFECPVRFDAGRTKATFRRDWFERPLKTDDGELRDLYRRNLEQLKGRIEGGGTTGTRLRGLFLKGGGRVPALDEAARILGLSPRTLRRKLREEGVSYRAMVEEWRVELARECLLSGGMSAKQVSDHVGFDDVNAFRRAFKKWTGRTVRAYGLELRAEADGEAENPGRR